jgi:chemotaxis protein methyltransferase CheR
VAEVRLLRSRTKDEWDDPELAAVARVLQETTGLVFPPNRREPAEAGMRRAMTQLGFDAFDLRRAIAVPGDARDALVTELTIGETFFFREAGQLDYLRDSVLPRLLESIGGRRPLRIWSAGTATGEEVYSLAMVLREASWPHPAALLGTDLVPARLAAARRGRYTHWSMRGVSDTLIDRYFKRQNEYFVVRDDIRSGVELRAMNLAADEYPSPTSGVMDMDVIFCRNVLIYFDKPNVEAIARRLLASLTPDGWLFLGASDPAIADVVPCEVVLTGAGLAYRPLAERDARAGRTPWQSASDRLASSAHLGAEPIEVAPLSTLPPVPAAHTRRLPVFVDVPIAGERDHALLTDQPAARPESYDDLYARGEYSLAADAARRAVESGDASERAWTVMVRSLANEGKLAPAGEAAAAALDNHALSAEVTYLSGMLLAQGGRHADAAQAFKRALYLDARFVIAHLALGDALFAAGDSTSARRAYANAESLLRSMNDEDPVAGADGIPAARLLHIARYHLQRLPDSRTSRPARDLT